MGGTIPRQSVCALQERQLSEQAEGAGRKQCSSRLQFLLEVLALASLDGGW